jgi:hypothetical protein
MSRRTKSENINARLKEESLPTKVLGETSTTDEVLSGVNLKGKRVLVTGVSTGLGVETARSLAAHGAQVVGAARDLKKSGRCHGSSEEGRRS